MATVIIEHLEPEMYPWCVLEYKHISKRVGKANLIFTNVVKGADNSETALSSLPRPKGRGIRNFAQMQFPRNAKNRHKCRGFKPADFCHKIKDFGEVKREKVSQLKLKKACVLDPAAKETLTPEIAKKFNYFIFGGILGDNPQRFRTKKFLTTKLKLPAFNLGDKQMSTDTAVIVCKRIIDGTNLTDLEFVEEYEIKEGKNLSRILPYRYLTENGRVIFTPELRNLLKKLKANL